MEVFCVWICCLFLSISPLSVKGGAPSDDMASPEVFSPDFYINTNVEVMQAGIKDFQAAREHWLHHGIDQGLQGCGDFHSVQYLLRYPDLVHTFGGHNYRAAVAHYLNNGLREKRLGYVEGGHGGRWTVSDDAHRLFVGAASRMGAAIDSVVWNHKEFINSRDHGRELQMAMNFLPYGECFNPTEAGGALDSLRDSTHTVIQNVQAQGHTLSSKVLAAWWKQPGEITAAWNCHVRMPSLDKSLYQHHYQYPMAKNVTLKCPGVSQPCIHFQSSFTIAGPIPEYRVVQMEAPTGYMSRDFTHFRSLDPKTGHLGAYHSQQPLVLSTPDDQYAMGVYAPPKQDTDLDMYYGKFEFKINVEPAQCTKWNVVFRKHNFPAHSTHVLNYDAYLCVGSVHDVTACLKALLNDHQHLIG